MANDINTVGFSGPLPDERTVRVDPHRVTIGGGATFGDVQVPLILALGLRGFIWAYQSGRVCVLALFGRITAANAAIMVFLERIRGPPGFLGVCRADDREHTARGFCADHWITKRARLR